MSEIKVDALSTVSGSGNLTVDTDTLVVDTTNEKIGINQASPTYQLTVKAATQSTVEIESASTTGESRLYFTDPDSTGTGEVGYYHNGDTMRFATGGAERMRLSSAGLHIGGTGAANALDDYEEGTFTPTFSFTNGNGNLTVASPTGHYIKIGNMVHIQGYIKLATRGTANGVCRISSIPFTNINSGSSYAAGSVWMNGMNSGAPMDGDFMQYLIINPGGDHMRLWCLAGNGTVHEATQGDVQDQSDFMFTVTYRHA